MKLPGRWGSVYQLRMDVQALKGDSQSYKIHPIKEKDFKRAYKYCVHDIDFCDARFYFSTTSDFHTFVWLLLFNQQ